MRYEFTLSEEKAAKFKKRFERLDIIVLHYVDSGKEAHGLFYSKGNLIKYSEFKDPVTDGKLIRIET